MIFIQFAQILLYDLYDDTKCLCAKLKPFGQMKAELWAEKFGDFENGLVCIFSLPTWMLQYKCIEIS